MKPQTFPFMLSALASVMLSACGGGGNSTPSTSTASSSAAVSSMNSSSSSAPNTKPIFTGTASTEIAEGSLATGYKAIANDQDGDALTYSLIAGADTSAFTIDPNSGELRFRTVADFEKPLDSNADNLYEIEVQVSDGRGDVATQAVTVKVKDTPSLISDISFTSDGRHLSAAAVCEGCDSQVLSFEWYIEGQDAAVSTGPIYTMPIADRDKKIYLKAITTDLDGSIEVETLGLMWNRAEEFTCYFLDGVGGCPVATMRDGTIIPFGQAENIQNVDLTDMERVYSNVNAFAGLKKDGTVVTWGNDAYGADSSAVELTDIVDITPGNAAFAALKSDGSVIVWGDELLGGNAEQCNWYGTLFPLCVTTQTGWSWENGSSCIARTTCNSQPSPYGVELDLSNVQKVYSNGRAFAALKKDGSVVTWGEAESGGDSSGADLTDIIEIYSDSNTRTWHRQYNRGKHGAFAALKSNGSVVAWGDPNEGGEPGFDINNVKKVFTNGRAYAALKENGNVVTWGNPSYGGDSTNVSLTNIVKIVSNSGAFAALDANKNVVSWGDDSFGSHSGAVTLTNILDIIAIEDSFAAVTDSQVQSWGNTKRIEDLDGGTIFSGNAGYAILNKNGALKTWGEDWASTRSAEDVSNVLINFAGFTVHFVNGKTSGWGYSSWDSEASRRSNYVFDKISFINDWQWAGVTEEGEVLLWGNHDSAYGGDSLGNISLEPGFVEISNSLTP